MDTIEAQLQSLLREKFGGDPQMSDGLAFIGVDSIGMAELTLELENRFGIRVGEDIVSVDTVQDLANYVRQRRDAPAT